MTSVPGIEAGVQARSGAPIVLVHGGWRGGWSWRRVADRLGMAGHPVFAPTLTGLGDRSHLFSPAIGLSTHIRDIVNLIEWEGLDNVVLCGHSYGGMVITGVAERLHSRIKSLVYLDAFLPGAGASLFDQLPDAMRQGFLEAAKTLRGEAVPPPPAVAFLVNEADRAWVDAKCTPQPMATFLEKIASVDGLARVATKIYVLASTYNSPAFAPIAARLRGDPAWRVVEIAAGHDLMIDEPDAVVEIVRRAAAEHLNPIERDTL